MHFSKKDPGFYDGESRVALTLKTEDVDASEGTFSGYASVFGKKDLDDEIVDPGAFKRTLGRRKTFPLLWQHDRGSPIGTIESAEEDKRGLRVQGRLALGVSRADDALVLLRQKVITGMSIGFRVVKDLIDRTEGVRRLKEVDLWEVSLVTFPANPAARVARVKSPNVDFAYLPVAPDGYETEAAEAAARVISGGKTTALAWWPDGDPDCSIKELVIGDVLESGETVIVPALLQHAAAWFFCNSSEVPEEDRGAVKSALDRHLDSLGLSAPWGAVPDVRAFVHQVETVIPHLDSATLKSLRSALGDQERTRVASRPFAWLDGEGEPDLKSRGHSEDVAGLFAWLDSD